MSDMNNVTMIGRFVRDPEMSYSQDGNAICKFSIAVNGYKENDVSFFNCISFRKAAEVISQYMKKGSRIGIAGKLQQRSWDDKDGNKRSTVEIIVNDFQFLDTKKEAQ